MRIGNWWIGWMLGMLSLNTTAQVRGFFSNSLAALDSATADCLSMAENPASLSLNGTFEMAAFAGKYLQVPGLNFVTLGIKDNLAGTAAGLQVSHTGTSGYQENLIEAGLGKELGAFLAGAVFRLRLISIPGVSSITDMGARLGFIFRKEPLSMGGSLEGSGFFDKSLETANPGGFTAAGQVLLKIAPEVLIGAGIEKTGNLPSMAQAEVFYSTSGLQFRLCADIGREQYSLQIGWERRQMLLRVMIGYQGKLGPSSGLHVLYRKNP